MIMFLASFICLAFVPCPLNRFCCHNVIRYGGHGAAFCLAFVLHLFPSRWQAEWDNVETGRSVCSIIQKITNSCTGPENASNSPLVMGPSPTTLRDSVSIQQTTADMGK
ncbi:hypothetical protein AVEN_164609-1 [Araneus ventricosus]|uniref:Secreted protein n=1 Tax=Araneus ventricosus TaxID=182803 RepID=A0A4Y2B587_ARAVE|nr:hypothetical protein AVEN_164609-1 [Araneus ventricosus]